jgi:hypothetical protein
MYFHGETDEKREISEGSRCPGRYENRASLECHLKA